MSDTALYHVGVIGYGWAANAHIAAINATTRGRVTAVCSSRPLDPAELSAKQNDAQLRDLLAAQGITFTAKQPEPGK